MLFGDEEATLLIIDAAEHLNTADLPTEIAEALAMGDIVTGDTFRRVVARTMAQQCALKFERVYMPFQHALSTRARTDCVACVVRSLMELDPRKTLLSTTSSGRHDGGIPHQSRTGVIASICQILLRQRLQVRVV